MCRCRYTEHYSFTFLQLNFAFNINISVANRYCYAAFVDGSKHCGIFGHSLGQCAIDRISLILDFLAQPESKPL